MAETDRPRRGSRLSKGSNTNINDRVMTPPELAEACVKWAGIKPGEVCYEPCRGEGSFHRLLPPGSPWAEIDSGRDMFEFDPGPVDIVITNPPYSCLGEFLEHMFKVVRPKRVILLAPITNLVTKKRLRDTFDSGYTVSRCARVVKRPASFPATGFQHVLVEYVVGPSVMPVLDW